MTKSQPLVLVTGASSGIGAATCLKLAKNGYKLILIARGTAALENLVKQMPPQSAYFYALDASDAASVLSVAKEIQQTHGVPDVIVHCAGAGVWRFIEETSPREMQQMMGAPFMADYHFTHAFMAPMLQRNRGHLIHINSPASTLGWPGATGYMAARWALRGLHEALTLDLAGTGVISTEIVFAKVKSEYFKNNPGSEERLPGVAKMVRELSPEECADVIFQTILKPKRRVIYPTLLKAFYVLNAIAPAAVRYLAVQTGKKH